jgi:cell wall-associated NlpC family hydrolase
MMPGNPPSPGDTILDLLDRLPPGFRLVRYDGTRIPDGTHDLSAGANCQSYAYAVLAQFGLHLPPLRSSELWADTEATRPVADFEPLDLLLFGPEGEPFGAHVAIYAGEGQALHLCKSVGQPVIWRLEQFADRPEYRVLLGGKRVSPLR